MFQASLISMEIQYSFTLPFQNHAVVSLGVLTGNPNMPHIPWLLLLLLDFGTSYNEPTFVYI